MNNTKHPADASGSLKIDPRRHRVAMLALLLGSVLITAGLIRSDPVAAKRESIPIALSSPSAPGVPEQSATPPPSSEASTSERRIELEVRRGDSLSLIFNRSGLRESDLQRLLDVKDASRSLRDLYPGQTIVAAVSGDGTLEELRVPLSPTETKVFLRTGDSFDLTAELKVPELRRAFRHAVVRSSLFEAGLDAGMSSRMILELANVFGGVLDFALDPRVGDTFSVLFEERYIDGEKIGDGAVIAAEYVNQGRRYSAFRFVDDAGQAGYFSVDGVSMRKAFLRAPLDFTRVTSNFNMRRLHPVMKVVRPHRGVDYGAPTGTPVYASGDGRVLASSYNRSNGNYVFIEHDNRIVTRYLHLHKRTVRPGQRVQQGQTIGTVGSTGLATGPHLHYEFLVAGVHRNPRTVLENLPRARSLDGKELARFRSSIAGTQSQLATYTQAWSLAIASDQD